MKSFVITEAAIHSILMKGLSDQWFASPNDDDLAPLKVIEADAAYYVLHPSCLEQARLLVIECREDQFFGGVPESDRRSVFDRCARIALRAFGETVALNPRWMPYHQGNKVSIFAYSDIGRRERIVAEVHPLERNDVVVYGLIHADQAQDLDAIVPNLEKYSAAVGGFSEAVKLAKKRQVGSATGSIELDDVTPGDFSNNLSYSEWYPKYLSKRQLEFVDLDLVGPIRLRGAAGTGKTLAMIIKALKTAYDAKVAGEQCRILFTTHSWAGAELVDRVMERIDDQHLMRSGSDGIKIDIFPLLTLAEKRDYSKIGRTPLGIDSADGKRRTLKEISEVVAGFVSSDWIAYRSGCSQEFIKFVESPSQSRTQRLLCWDLLIEFGCVLAAQGILGHASHEQRYLRIRRMRWMMSLVNETEKRVVFALWVKFLSVLKERSLIASDQIISDYLNELSTFYWEAARAAEGYDVVFVDEMHLFNAQERLIFHNLLADPDRAPRVVMAMDPKQSPRETFTDIRTETDEKAYNIYERARLPNPESIDLTDVYRYTPEIDRIIKTLNEVAPALDLPSDWDIPAGHSNIPNGSVPVYTVVENKLSAFRTAMATAHSYSKAAREQRGRVAVLCLDEDRFEEYTVAASAQHRGEVLIIASRDDTEQLRYAGKKYILSTPEYVAGLQFDTVILVDANKEQVPEGQYNGHLLRRFLSELYLGISRAERRLAVIASKDAGGITDLFKKAIDDQSLRYVAELPEEAA
ncbi:hypothetical protein [Sinorhizobium meliloti]|uniref:hypothetical protein n=1 Tax=Rhizobium meliloti TaxID=382 RepID=UPI00035F0DD3|nr:hypothetical protein [Sinorhizobium meliloti]